MSIESYIPMWYDNVPRGNPYIQKIKEKRTKEVKEQNKHLYEGETIMCQNEIMDRFIDHLVEVSSIVNDLEQQLNKLTLAVKLMKVSIENQEHDMSKVKEYLNQQAKETGKPEIFNESVKDHIEKLLRESEIRRAPL